MSVNNTEFDAKDGVTFFLYALTASTPLRKDIGVFKRLGRFIGLKCHDNNLFLCFVYK